MHAHDDFNKHAEKYFEKTIFTYKVRIQIYDLAEKLRS